MNHVTLDNKQYPVKYSFQALSEFEKLTGMNALSLDVSKLGATEIIALAYVGLKGGDSSFGMDKDEVGRVIKSAAFQEVMKALSEDMKDLTEDKGGK